MSPGRPVLMRLRRSTLPWMFHVKHLQAPPRGSPTVGPATFHVKHRALSSPPPKLVGRCSAHKRLRPKPTEVAPAIPSCRLQRMMLIFLVIWNAILVPDHRIDGSNRRSYFAPRWSHLTIPGTAPTLCPIPRTLRTARHTSYRRTYQALRTTSPSSQGHLHGHGAACRTVTRLHALARQHSRPRLSGASPIVTPQTNHPVCDYEGSAYRTEFWGAGREYEDGAERIALQRMLPSTGRRLIDIGGGYGRLVPLYAGYDEVLIFDYALSQLREARRLWGHGGAGGPNLTYVAGDFYRLPFAAATFDTVVIVRALHHATNAPAVLRGVGHILASDGTLILEFANKRNLKAILRFILGRQTWSPFEKDPVEFVSLNFDFHPVWINHLLRQQGLEPRDRRAVSTFRLAILKRLLPTPLLVALDRLCQPLGRVAALSPSVFVRANHTAGQPMSPVRDLFRCINCGSTDLTEHRQALVCHACRRSYPLHDGIYDFRPTRNEQHCTSPSARQPGESNKAEAYDG